MLELHLFSGVGRKLAHKLESLGIQNCAQLQKLPLERLTKEFGPKSGTRWLNAFGLKLL